MILDLVGLSIIHFKTGAISVANYDCVFGFVNCPAFLSVGTVGVLVVVLVAANSVFAAVLSLIAVRVTRCTVFEY